MVCEPDIGRKVLSKQKQSLLSTGCFYVIARLEKGLCKGSDVCTVSVHVGVLAALNPSVVYVRELDY